MGYLIGEVADPELTKDKLEELTAFITQSGRVSKPVTYLHPKGKGKEKMVEEVEIEVQKQTREAEEKKENEIFEEAIRKSHLLLIEQLIKMPTQVSILGLLLTSEQHRERFLNIFRKSFVDASITPNRLENIVVRVSMPRVITFLEDEIPEADIVYNKAIYITTRHSNMCIPLILVDNGSTLNIYTKDTLDTLGVPPDCVKPNPYDIRAFNNLVSRGQGEVFIIEGRMFQV